MSVVLTGNDLAFSQLYAVALKHEPVSLSTDSITRMEASRAIVDKLVAEGQTAYGINTGFGKLATNRDKGVEAIYFRHIQVHQGDIRAVCAELLDGLTPIWSLGSQCHVRLNRQKPRDSLPHEGMVVNRQHPNLFRIGNHGFLTLSAQRHRAIDTG